MHPIVAPKFLAGEWGALLMVCCVTLGGYQPSLCLSFLDTGCRSRDGAARTPGPRGDELQGAEGVTTSGTRGICTPRSLPASCLDSGWAQCQAAWGRALSSLWNSENPGALEAAALASGTVP